MYRIAVLLRLNGTAIPYGIGLLPIAHMPTGRQCDSGNLPLALIAPISSPFTRQGLLVGSAHRVLAVCPIA